MTAQIQSLAVNQVEINYDFQLQEEFFLGAKKFAKNPLHQKIASTEDIRESLRFVPRMLFFVMGFKDLMSIVRYESPKNDLEKSVNTHSDEDSNHWVWYLKDLEYINAKFKNAKSAELIAGAWSDDTLEVRKTIYTFSRYIQQFENPVARMLMIEVLEITFDKFKEAIHPALKGADLYSHLDYFGRMHQETEENHSTGISDDEIAELIEILPQDQKRSLLPVIKILFDQMYNMARNWAEA